MIDKMIGSVTYSVSVTLATLDSHLDFYLREKIYKALHVESLAGCHVQVDVLNDGINFYKIEVME